MVLELLDSGADKDARDQDGRSALFWAARFGYTDIVKDLVAEGADTAAKDSDGNTALEVARKYKRQEVESILSGAV